MVARAGERPGVARRHGEHGRGEGGLRLEQHGRVEQARPAGRRVAQRGRGAEHHGCGAAAAQRDRVGRDVRARRGRRPRRSSATMPSRSATSRVTAPIAVASASRSAMRRHRLAGEAVEQLPVAGGGALDDVRREPRRGAGAVPVATAASSRTICLSKLDAAVAAPSYVRRVPVAARVAGEHLVGERDLAASCASAPNSNFVSASITPRVLGDRRRPPVDRRARARAAPSAVVAADELDGALEGDVLVVLAQLGLERGRVDRLGQPVAVDEPGGQRARRRRCPSRGTPRSRCP